MDDRFTAGFIAGVFGGTAANAWGLFSGAIGFTSLRFVDWAGIMTFGHRPPFSSGEIFFALVTNIGLCGVLGIFFVFLITQITSKNLSLKGLIFAESAWFFFYSVSILFKVDGIAPLPLATCISDFIAAAIFGLVQAYVLQKLAVASSIRHTPAMVPALKQFDPEDDDNHKK